MSSFVSNPSCVLKVIVHCCVWIAFIVRSGLSNGDELIRVTLDASPVLHANQTHVTTLRLENTTNRQLSGKLSHTLQLNSALAETEQAHPVLGYDHAIGATAGVQLDGESFGDPQLTDGNEFTSFESPWTKGYHEAIVVMELDQVRRIQAMKWVAADANWIWKIDAEYSIDGNSYEPIASLQDFDMHKKWGQNEFPLDNPIVARFLRLRFYKPGETMNIVRLPRSIKLFDGIQNDVIVPPVAGQQIEFGESDVTLGPMESRLIPVKLKTALSPGAYLLTWNLDCKEYSHQNWAPVFVRPGDIPDKNATRRFGINASNVQLADLLSECGFGWVRFENGKWSMSSDAKDHYNFTGGIAPWHVDQDSIYQAYHDRNMKVMPYVFQTPEWATSAGVDVQQNRFGYPPRNPADYGEAIYQFAARFGSRRQPADSLLTDDQLSGLKKIDAIELWNEPNLVGPAWAPFVGPIEQYFEVMRAGVKGARRADPDLLVTSCGWAGVEPATVQQMTSYRYPDGTCPLDLVDVVNVHFYSGVQDPEVAIEDPNIRKDKTSTPSQTYLEQLDELIRWRDAHKLAAQIWMTETGNDVGGPIGLSERKQAAKLPRVTMITLARGIDKVFIYRESGSVPSMHAGAGLIRDDGTLRPSWFTMATLMRQLADYNGRGERIPHVDPNVWILRWTEEERSMVAAWTIGSPVNIDIRQFSDGKTAKSIVDAFGHACEIGTSDEVSLSEFPTYISFNADDRD